jgi:hypothetical protein
MQHDQDGAQSIATRHQRAVAQIQNGLGIKRRRLVTHRRASGVS